MVITGQNVSTFLKAQIALGMTPQDIAKRTGWPLSNISRLINYPIAEPYQKTIQHICDTFHVTREDIVNAVPVVDVTGHHVSTFLKAQIALGMSRKEIAKQTRWSVSDIDKLISNPPARLLQKTIQKICNTFHVTREDIVNTVPAVDVTSHHVSIFLKAQIASGISRKEITERTGWSVSDINRLTNNPPTKLLQETIQKICDAFHVTREDIVNTVPAVDVTGHHVSAFLEAQIALGMSRKGIAKQTGWAISYVDKLINNPPAKPYQKTIQKICDAFHTCTTDFLLFYIALTTLYPDQPKALHNLELNPIFSISSKRTIQMTRQPGYNESDIGKAFNQYRKERLEYLQIPVEKRSKSPHSRTPSARPHRGERAPT